MLHTDEKELVAALRMNQYSKPYHNLIEYLQLRLDHTKEVLVLESDVHKIYTLQGRAQELREMLDALRRKPVMTEEFHTGAFN